MSIKEQMEFAKEEFTQDEKLLAGLIKVERFYRRNKIAIIFLTLILVVGAIGYGVMGYLKEKRVEAANAALLKLQENPNDSSALKSLEESSPKLSQLFRLKRAALSGDTESLKSLSKSEDAVVADLASYHRGAWKEDSKALKSYRMKSQALLKDFATFDEAYLLMKAGKIEEGRERLALIGADSPMRAAASMLEHYGVAHKSRGGE
ncbi:MAG: hypothetical protein L3J42_05055 [Hydrogenimonas sp.]|nr:hypothetical protein [Hydrogenimonas sp.]